MRLVTLRNVTFVLAVALAVLDKLVTYQMARDAGYAGVVWMPWYETASVVAIYWATFYALGWVALWLARRARKA